MQKYLLPIFFTLIFTLFATQGFAQTVAVFEFDCDNKDFDGNIAMMTDLLIHELVKSGEVTVVERKRLDKIMAEYAFQSSPFVDIKTAKKLGKGLGADCIIVGTVAALGCPLYITARMVDVEKGTILHSAKMTLNYWSDYEQKLPAFAAECVRKMPAPNYFTGVWTGTLSGNDFEDYCWFIENKRSNGKVYYANRRRRRDLAALKYYESHDGEKKFVEDYGNDR